MHGRAVLLTTALSPDTMALIAFAALAVGVALISGGAGTAFVTVDPSTGGDDGGATGTSPLRPAWMSRKEKNGTGPQGPTNAPRLGQAVLHRSKVEGCRNPPVGARKASWVTDMSRLTISSTHTVTTPKSSTSLIQC